MYSKLFCKRRFCPDLYLNKLVLGLCLLIAGAANCGPDSIVAGSISMEVWNDCRFSIGFDQISRYPD